MEPGIVITPTSDGVAIRQRRPAVTGMLASLPVGEALIRIPTLLPICGTAQAIAGRRAANAARGVCRQEDDDTGRALYREQALAAAWRLAIDWPTFLGEERNTGLLKKVRAAASDTALATALLEFVPGLDLVNASDDLTAWIDQANCLAARLLREVRRYDAPPHAAPGPSLSDGEDLLAHVRSAFAFEDFDALAPAGAGIEVGPLAMRRHVLVERLCTHDRYGVLCRRLLAQLLDTCAIAARLRGDASEPSDNAWQEGDGIGLGRAMTARGPVFHQVVLRQGDDDQVARWRVLAPTDWHFAPGGPLDREAGALEPDAARLPMQVLGFDPCAPWKIVEAESGHA